MKYTKSICAISLLLLLPACLSTTLRQPAADHYLQASAIADSCEADGYGRGKCTQEDLDAMAKQAECILALTEGRACG